MSLGYRVSPSDPHSASDDLSASAGKRKLPFPKASNLSSTSHSSCCFRFTPLALCAPFPIMQQACTMSCIFLHRIFLQEPLRFSFFQMCQSLFKMPPDPESTLLFTRTDTHTRARAHTHTRHSYMVSSGEGKKRDTHLHIPRSFHQRTQHAISQQEQIVVLYKCVRLEGTRRWSPLHASLWALLFLLIPIDVMPGKNRQQR